MSTVAERARHALKQDGIDLTGLHPGRSSVELWETAGQPMIELDIPEGWGTSGRLNFAGGVLHALTGAGLNVWAENSRNIREYLASGKAAEVHELK